MKRALLLMVVVLFPGISRIGREEDNPSAPDQPDVPWSSPEIHCAASPKGSYSNPW